MKDLFCGFKFIRAYIGDPLILKKGRCKDHVQKLELTLNRPKGKYLNVILKSVSSERPKCNI